MSKRSLIAKFQEVIGMNIKSALSILALSTSLAFTGSVMAQTSINGVDVSDADLPAVQERCDQLLVADTTASTSTATESSEPDSNASDDSSGAADATIEDAPAVNEMANMTSTIDLDTIDLQACLDAGLVTR
jgi:hypothetical protein